jgi:hypothetical protein
MPYPCLFGLTSVASFSVREPASCVFCDLSPSYSHWLPRHSPQFHLRAPMDLCFEAPFFLMPACSLLTVYWTGPQHHPMRVSSPCFSSFLYRFISVYECYAYMYIWLPCTCLVPMRIRRWGSDPLNWSLNGYELPCTWWKMNLGPLQGQQILKKIFFVVVVF